MNLTILCVSAALLGSATGPGDRRGLEGRVVAGMAGAASASAVSLPRFTLFGWVSPPDSFATQPRYAELAGAGFNVTVLAWDDSGRVADNRSRLAWCGPLAVHNLLFDRTLESVAANDTTTWAAFDTVVARYTGEPAFLGYYLGDEPGSSDFATLSLYFGQLRARDPAHPGWNNLRGRSAFTTRDDFLAYSRDYVAQVRPSVLCNDQYDFLVSGDAHQLVENVAGLASVARESGLPFWGIVLLVQHGVYRQVTAGMLRWQIAQWLSYGASGIGYFTYWTPAPDPRYDWQPAMITYDGTRTAMYDTVRTLNARLRPLGEALAGMTWLATEHAGSVPQGGTPFAPDSLLAAVDGRATLGLFADTSGAPCVLVASADSLAPAVVTLTLVGGRRAWRWQGDGGWTVQPVGPGGRATLALDAGDFALLRLSGAVDSLSAGFRAPRLAVAPNPSRGSARFSIRSSGERATLEVLDLAGRRVWSRRLGMGETGIAWDGARDQGGRAEPGLYFARLEDTHGVSVRRLSWLGSP